MSNSTKCTVCNNEINNFKYKPMQQWNVFGYLSGDCYSKKLVEYYHPPTNIDT